MLDSVPHVRFWYRFYVRLTLVYGGAFVLMLLAMSILFYRISVFSEMESLKRRLELHVSLLAEKVNAMANLDLFVDYPSKRSLFYRRLHADFFAVIDKDDDIHSIYILAPTTNPTELKFLIDFVRQGSSGQPGQLYRADDIPLLLKAFNGMQIESEPVKDEFGLSLSGYAPLYSRAGKPIAVLGVDILFDRIQAMKLSILKATVLVFGTALALIVIASLWIASSIRKPLHDLVVLTGKVADGQLDASVGVQRKDEFGLLCKHFDGMVCQLREREILKDTFGKYISQTIMRLLLSSGVTPQLGGEERVVTVLFSDLKNYTMIAEKLSASQTVEMLNEYFTAMDEVIEQHQGCIIEFLGDALLVVFGAPYYYNDHALKAIDCARAMQARLRELNQHWQMVGLADLWLEVVPAIEMRIGIHTGAVVVGNLGSRTRMKYAVIGDAVNVAARLECLNNELQSHILVSEETKNHLPSQEQSKLISAGCHGVKGREKPVRVFQADTLRTGNHGHIRITG